MSRLMVSFFSIPPTLTATPPYLIFRSLVLVHSYVKPLEVSQEDLRKRLKTKASTNCPGWTPVSSFVNLSWFFLLKVSSVIPKFISTRMIRLISYNILCTPWPFSGVFRGLLRFIELTWSCDKSPYVVLSLGLLHFKSKTVSQFFTNETAIVTYLVDLSYSHSLISWSCCHN